MVENRFKRFLKLNHVEKFSVLSCLSETCSFQQVFQLVFGRDILQLFFAFRLSRSTMYLQVPVKALRSTLCVQYTTSILAELSHDFPLILLPQEPPLFLFAGSLDGFSDFLQCDISENSGKNCIPSGPSNCFGHGSLQGCSKSQGVHEPALSQAETNDNTLK